MQRLSFGVAIFSQDADNIEIGVGVLRMEQYSEISAERCFVTRLEHVP